MASSGLDCHSTICSITAFVTCDTRLGDISERTTHRKRSRCRVYSFLGIEPKYFVIHRGKSWLMFFDQLGVKRAKAISRGIEFKLSIFGFYAFAALSIAAIIWFRGLVFFVAKMLIHSALSAASTVIFFSIWLNSVKSSGVLIPLAAYLAKASSSFLFILPILSL